MSNKESINSSKVYCKFLTLVFVYLPLTVLIVAKCIVNQGKEPLTEFEEKY